MNLKTKLLILEILSIICSVGAVSCLTISLFNLSYYLFLYISSILFGLNVIFISLSLRIQGKVLESINNKKIVKHWYVLLIIGGFLMMLGAALVIFYFI